MSVLAWTKVAIHAVAILVTSTVLVHAGHPYSPQVYTTWLKEFQVPSPPGYVDFGIGPCASSDDLGCMEWTKPIATVRMARSDRLDRFTFAHELGHVFDYYVLAPTGNRSRFAVLEGFPWTTPKSEEYFADSYALCALHRQLQHTVVTDYGFRVTPALHEQICSLIRSAYAQWLASPPASLLGQSLGPS
jgi:hypothetical protein